MSRKPTPTSWIADLPVEVSQGAGLGEPLSPEESRAMMASITVRRPLKSWAGPVANAEATAARLGITRGELDGWLKAGRILCAHRANGEQVYPVEQFVGGQPVKGLDEVIAICPTPRTAWMWLRRPSSFFDGRTPLEALRNGELTAVFAVSHQLFDPC